VARAEAYLHAKFDLNPSNGLATIHQCHRQDRTESQTGQTEQSDSTGKTVLQTVAQKPHKIWQQMLLFVEELLKLDGK